MGYVRAVALGVNNNDRFNINANNINNDRPALAIAFLPGLSHENIQASLRDTLLL